MLRGFYKYVCADCGHEFIGADIEWQATALSQPVKCPKCGSYHTRMASLLKQIKFLFWVIRGMKGSAGKAK